MDQPTSVIVVTGQGLGEDAATPAYDVHTIQRDDLTASASGRIEDVLSSVAGFQQYRRSDSRSSNPSNQGVTLRALGGNASSRAVVLLDGVPVTNPFFGYVPFSALVPDRLRAVRVTRGGGMGAFGQGAVSGTIELESAGPDEIGKGQILTLVDNRGETQSSFVVAPRLGDGFVVAGFQQDRGQGFWTTPEDQRVPASARARYDSWSAFVRAVAPLTSTVEVQASGLAYDDSRTLRFKGADSRSSGQQASLRLVGRGDWKFDAIAYVQAQDFSNVVISSTTYKETLNQKKTPTISGGGKLELRPPVGADHVLRLGADLRLIQGHLLEEPYSNGVPTAFRRGGGKQSDIGLYAQEDWTRGRWVFTAGARLDRWTIRDGFYRSTSTSGIVSQNDSYADRDGWSVNGRGGAVWNATSLVSVRVAGYTGLRVPTLNELYRPYVVFPTTTQANAALKPERLRGYEGGVDLHPAGWLDLTFTAFDNRLLDAIANVTIGTNLQQRQNVQAIHTRGIEAGGEARAGRLVLSGSLAFTDAKVEAQGSQSRLNGLRPAQVPRFAASGTVAWAPRDRWRLAATLQHTGMQYDDDLNTSKLPAATTLDLVAQVPIASPAKFPATLVLRAENVTDVQVETRNQSGSIDITTPRTLWAGLRISVR
nr:TonB-dependent receptor [Novosphingobium sp. Rr 2-17]